MMRFFNLLSLLMLLTATTFAGTTSWTGASNSSWTNALNWSSGVPTNGDIVIFPGTALHQNITDVPNTAFKSLAVRNDGGTAVYTLTASGPVTVELGGGGTANLSIETGASLTVASMITISTDKRDIVIAGTFVMNGPLTVLAGPGSSLTVTPTGNFIMAGPLTYDPPAGMVIDGTMTLSGSFSSATPQTISGAGSVIIPETATVTLNQSVTFLTALTVDGTLAMAGNVTTTISPAGNNTATVSVTGHIQGNGHVNHSNGNLHVDGEVTNNGNFVNLSSITGSGTVEVGGAITNSAPMFGFNGVPPGQILSGYTWKGTNGSDWNDPANWFEGAVPVAMGDVVVYSQANLPEITTSGNVCRQLYIHSGGVLTLGPTGELTTTGKTRIKEPAGMVIRSTSAGTGSFIDNGNISYSGGGTIMVQQYFAPDRWHGYSAPFTSSSTDPYIDYYMKWYDEQGHTYRYVLDLGHTDSSWSKPGLGFMMWSSSSLTNTTPVSPEGQLNNGPVNINVTRSYGFIPWTGTSDFDGWNLVGNPYASSLRLDLSAENWTLVEKRAWIWDPAAGNYVIWDSAGTGTRTSNLVAPNQGFFVHCYAPATTYNAGTGTVRFLPAERRHSAEPFVKETMQDMLTFKVITAANGYSDQAVLHFSSTATEGIDLAEDASKMAGLENAPQLWFPADGNELTVNALPWTDESGSVQLNYSMSVNTSAIIEVSGIESFSYGTALVLEDTKEGIFHDLQTDPSYSFSSSADDDEGRFILHYTRSAVGIAEQESGINIFGTGDAIIVSGTLQGSGTMQVIDLMGRVVYSGLVRNSGTNTYVTGLKSGYYIIKVVTETESKTAKVYLR